MFTITYKGFAVACETAQDAVAFCDAADQPTTKPKARGLKTLGDLEDRVEERKRKERNEKARAAYKDKQKEKKKKKVAAKSTTTSRLEALPSKPTGAVAFPQKRAKTGAAVIATLKRSPQPLSLEEIDTDLEKSGWPYKGKDRKGAIRATLARLKASGTVSTFMHGTGLTATQMFRLERTNGDTPSPVEQVLNGKEEPTREERAEVEDSENQMLQDEARADAEREEEDEREFF